jgi:hypothetical protein
MLSIIFFIASIIFGIIGITKTIRKAVQTWQKQK